MTDNEQAILDAALAYEAFMDEHHLCFSFQCDQWHIDEWSVHMSALSKATDAYKGTVN